MRSLPLLIVIKVFLGAACALAGGEPYGKFFVQDGARWLGELPPIAAAPPSDANKADARRLASLLGERLEADELRDGPYAIGLAETLDELARAQEALGDTEGALRSRDRALHLIRVNDGLYSVAQRPVLRAILNSLRQTGDFTALDERYDYFYRLYGSGQPPWDELRWSGVMEYLRWQREAIRRDLDGDPMDRLMRLHRLHEDLLENLRESSPDLDYAKFKDATLSQLKTLYLIEDLVEPLPVFPERRGTFRRMGDPRDFNLERERMENLQRMLRGSGRSLLEELLAVTPVDDLRGRAELQLALADWLLWLGSSREARPLYQNVWTLLQEAGLGDLASDWFSRPVALPDNGVFWQPEPAAANDGSLDYERYQGAGPFTVRLSVRDNGRASAELVAVDAGAPRSPGRLLRYISATRYRPVLKDGDVISVENVLVRYRLLRP